MTNDNYAYRTDPLFLRNQFDKIGKYGIPMIPRPQVSQEELSDLRLIGFDKIRSDEGDHANRMVHFFLYDYKFERVWKKPDEDIDNLKKYRAVLTPDYSMYTEMPEAMLLYNVFRNRWCGAYFASQGLRVIPTVNFGLENSFGFCFEGIERGSVVAVSTYMVRGKGYHDGQKEFFLTGYREMLRRIEPEAIICYHEPFPEMDGNIVYINYELSSWQHMDDDATSEKQSASADKSIATPGYRVKKYGGYVGKGGYSGLSTSKGYRIVKHSGYVVQLGAGSAFYTSNDSIDEEKIDIIDRENPPERELSTSDDFVDGEKIDVGDRDSLSENVRQAYDGYQKVGWKGNFAGQSRGTKAYGKYDNVPPTLPTKDEDGNSITYREFDVNNYVEGQARDMERFVVGSDGRVYYTNDHYQTFTLINE